MRIPLLIFVLAVLAIFLVQNGSPALPLILFGTQTIALPAALWLLVAILAGVATSLVLQLLSSWRGRFARAKKEIYNSPKPPPATRKKPEPPPRREDWENDSPRDWEIPPKPPIVETDEEDDWNIEQLPQEETRLQPEADEFEEFDNSSDRSRETDTEVDAPRVEVRRTPESSQKSGTFYSYRYREATPKDKERLVNNEDETVYDANYRVIRPPLWDMPPEPEPEDAEEDWGLDEDDEQQR